MMASASKTLSRLSWRSLTASNFVKVQQSQSLRALSTLQNKITFKSRDNFLVQPESLRWSVTPMRLSSSLSKADVESRVLTVCKAFDKITADKVTLDAHFINDLGLDSLDHVEVIMAIEDEFGFEIPDEHAEKLLTPAKIAQYVCDHEQVTA